MAVAAIVVTVILWHRGSPRRLLVYSMPVVTSVLTRRARFLMRAGLEVTYRGRALVDPHVALLRVESSSRQDISSKDFDQRRQLVFDLGTNIAAVVNDRLANNIVLPLSIEGSRVKIGPTLIRSGQVISIDVLTEGTPRLTCYSPLIDVRIKDKDSSRRPRHVAICFLFECVSVGSFIASRVGVGGLRGFFFVAFLLITLVTAALGSVTP
jgi:hypothetical protein